MGCADNDLFCSKITVILIGIGSAGLVVSIYHWISVAWCQYRSTAQQDVTRGGENTGIVSSTIQLIPAYSYKKEDNKKEEEDTTCPICLCEVQQGEQVRSLPECNHYFHVPCIDMWLYSHSSCPICRADATPPQSVFPTSTSGLVGDRDHRTSEDSATSMEHVFRILPWCFPLPCCCHL